MKKWEEERKKKQHAQKISGAKTTLKGQQKGAKMGQRSGNLSNSQWGGHAVSRYSHDYQDQMSMHPSRGQADFGTEGDQYLAMGSPGMEMNMEHQMQMEQSQGLMPQMIGGIDTGHFSNIEMFQKGVVSPTVNLENNLNYKHVKGMNATNFNKHSSTNNLPRETGGVHSMIGMTGQQMGSQYAKPRMRIHNSTTSQYGQSSKRSSHNMSQQKNYAGIAPQHERSTYQSSRYQERRINPMKSSGNPQLTDIPIYQLLKAFKLQQYTLKMTDLGYGYDVYKLALLSSAQREDFIDQLKVVPGHKAKIAGFFSVIDEIYPRSKVVEQISSVTPQRATGKGGKKRIASAGRTRYHLGPQKTLLQKYEKLDHNTKQAFNRSFVQTLESVKSSIGQIMQQHVNPDESNFAMSQIFPPDQFLGNAQRVLVEANALQGQGFNNEMELLVNKFTTGPTNQRHMTKQSEQYINRMKSQDRLNNRSSSKDHRLKDIDRINQEVEKKLKAQRKQEKDRIKKYGQIYGPNLFQNQKSMSHVKEQSRLQRSRSRERRIKSSSQSTRQLKQATTGRKPNFQLSRQHTVQKSIEHKKAGYQKLYNNQIQLNQHSVDEQYNQHHQYSQEQPHMPLDESVTHEQLSINIQTNANQNVNPLQMMPQESEEIPETEGPSASREGPSASREIPSALRDATPYQLPVDSYGLEELPSVDPKRMSKEEIENQLSENPSIFDQSNPDPNDDTQNQELLKGQLAQLQSQIKDMQQRRQQDDDDVDDDGYRKDFEDTTGGTSGVDVDGSDKKAPTEEQQSHTRVHQEDDYDDDYEDDQKELPEDVHEGLVLDQREVTQYGKLDDDSKRQTEEEYQDQDQFQDLEMSIDVNECQQQYKEIMQSQQRQRDMVEETELDDEEEDYSVQTPDVNFTEGEQDQLTAGSQKIDKLQIDDPQITNGQLNISELKNEQDFIVKQPPKPKRKLSPLLEANEKEAAFNLGQSLDSKKVTSALGYLDLKQICFCLARALARHIEFSQGCFFLDELKVMRQMGDQMPQDDKLEFSYNLGDQLKIDIEEAKKKQRDKMKKVEKSQQEFEQLKKQMETSQTSPVVKITPKQLTNSKFRSDIEQNDDSENEVRDKENEDDQIIDDETTQKNDKKQDDDSTDQQYIEDFYDNDKFGANKVRNNDGEDDCDEQLDMDYSQTQLDDFLKSHSNRGLTSHQLLQSFVSTYNKTKNQKSINKNQSAHGGSVRGLLDGSNHKINSLSSARLQHSEQKNNSSIQPIAEKILDEEHEESGNTIDKREAAGDDAVEEEIDDDIERSPEIVDLNAVKANDDTIDGNLTNNSDGLMFKLEKIPSEVSKKSTDGKDKGETNRTMKDLTTPKSRQLNLDDFDVSSKNGFQQLLRFHMRIFDQNYDFETDELVGGEAPYQGNPTLEELYYFCKYVIISGRMEKEIPILCLVYIERFLTKSGLLMNYSNWKRLTLISLILASKIWDDDSLENVHFPQVMSDITLKEITGLEKVFLQLVDFDLVIRGSEYAKYYFILKAFAEQFNSTLPMGPLSVPQMSHLQNNTVKAESELRERYNRKLNLQKSC